MLTVLYGQHGNCNKMSCLGITKYYTNNMFMVSCVPKTLSKPRKSIAGKSLELMKVEEARTIFLKILDLFYINTVIVKHIRSSRSTIFMLIVGTSIKLKLLMISFYIV